MDLQPVYKLDVNNAPVEKTDHSICLSFIMATQGTIWKLWGLIFWILALPLHIRYKAPITKCHNPLKKLLSGYENTLRLLGLRHKWMGRSEKLAPYSKTFGCEEKKNIRMLSSNLIFLLFENETFPTFDGQMAHRALNCVLFMRLYWIQIDWQNIGLSTVIILVYN